MEERKTRCAKCGTSMRFVSGMWMSADLAMQAEEASQCGECRRDYCSKCTDYNRLCECGERNWSTRIYLPSNEAQRASPKESTKMTVQCPHCGHPNSAEGMGWDPGRRCTRCGERLMPKPNLWVFAFLALISAVASRLLGMPEGVALAASVIGVVALGIAAVNFFRSK